MVALRREVGGQREAGRLHRVKAGAHQQERERRGALPDPGRRVRVAASRMRANGMMARPPNCSSVPNQR